MTSERTSCAPEIIKEIQQVLSSVNNACIFYFLRRISYTCMRSQWELCYSLRTKHGYDNPWSAPCEFVRELEPFFDIQVQKKISMFAFDVTVARCETPEMQSLFREETNDLMNYPFDSVPTKALMDVLRMVLLQTDRNEQAIETCERFVSAKWFPTILCVHHVFEKRKWHAFTVCFSFYRPFAIICLANPFWWRQGDTVQNDDTRSWNQPTIGFLGCTINRPRLVARRQCCATAVVRKHSQVFKTAYRLVGRPNATSWLFTTRRRRGTIFDPQRNTENASSWFVFFYPYLPRVPN